MIILRKEISEGFLFNTGMNAYLHEPVKTSVLATIEAENMEGYPFMKNTLSATLYACVNLFHFAICVPVDILESKWIIIFKLPTACSEKKSVFYLQN